jgi:hypothetical protein
MIVSNIILVDERFFNLEEISYFELKGKKIIVHRKDNTKTYLRFLRESDAEMAFASIPEDLRK